MKYLERCLGIEKYICLFRCKLWVCYICYRKFLFGIMFGECFMNKLENVEVLDVLRELNLVECYFVLRIILFKKMMVLFKGGQFGV